MKFSKKEFTRAKDLSFKKFGKWSTTDEVERVWNGHTYEIQWLVSCECNRVSKFVTGSTLTGGQSKSCELCRTDKIKEINSTIDGDSKKESLYHGLFVSHVNMKNRCYYKKDKSYKYYGEKGVYVCDEWHDYLMFKKWSLENGWKKDLVISRDGDIGIYEPSNCKWKTRSKNSYEAHYGIPSKKRKLNTKQVMKIRERYDTMKNMASDFGLKTGSINDILARRTYKEIR